MSADERLLVRVVDDEDLVREVEGVDTPQEVLCVTTVSLSHYYDLRERD